MNFIVGYKSSKDLQISEVYKSYKIPPNLQEHMMRAAAVGAFIAGHWIYKDKLDRDSIIQALLLHDAGNIIKFDFKFSHLLGEEQGNWKYWEGVQKEFKEKYGTDEHQATIEIAKEIGLGKKAFELLLAIGGANLEKALSSKDWNKKVACYSDFRIDPHGVVTVNSRFDEMVSRYKGRDHTNADVKEMEKRRKLCLTLQGQLQQMVDFDFDKLSDENIEGYKLPK